jgi:hypothetical protein
MSIAQTRQPPCTTTVRIFWPPAPTVTIDPVQGADE